MSNLSIDLLKKFTDRVYSGESLAGEGELLRDHALASALIALAIAPKQLINYLSNYLGNELRSRYLIALTALLHDWGKSLPPYQEYVKVRSSHAPIRHEVTTFILLSNVLRPRDNAEIPYYMFIGSILYHHHGLYDFVESIVKYLAGHRVWPREGVPNYLINDFMNELKDFLDSTSLSNYLIINEEVVDKFRGTELDHEVLSRAIEVEGLINKLRNLITPLLAQLMIADNAAASASRSGVGREGSRILLMTKASAPILVVNWGSIEYLLSNAGLTNYIEGLSKTLLSIVER